MLKNLLTFWSYVKSEEKKLIVFGIILWILTRFVGIGTFLTVDEPLWIDRSTQFVKSLYSLNFSGTFQAATEQASHPGVMLMWLGGFGIIIKNITEVFVNTSVGLDLILIKTPLVIFSALAFSLLVLITKRLIDYKYSVIFMLLLVFEPFLIAYTRLLHLDGLLSLLMFTSMLSLIYFLEKESNGMLIISGIFAGLSFLTKVPSLSLIPFALLIMVIYKKTNIKQVARIFSKWLATSSGIFVLLWPALWVTPAKALGSIFGAADKGLTLTHQGTGYSLMPEFYINSIKYFFSPWGIVLFVIGIFILSYQIFNKRIEKKYWAFLLFAVYFVVGMTIGAKKGERYILPAYPFMLAVSAYAIYFTTTLRQELINKIKYFGVLIPLIVIPYVLSFSPYYLSYFNPFFREPEKIGLGEGLEQAAYYLNQKPNAKDLKVATWYSNVFSKFFIGRSLDVDKNKETDYVVIYRNMKGRAPEDPVTAVFKEFESRTPEKTIIIKNIEYVWIYKNE